MTEDPRQPREPEAGQRPGTASGQPPATAADWQPAGAQGPGAQPGPEAGQLPYPASDQQGYGALQQPYGAAGQPQSKYGTTGYAPGAVGQEITEPKGWARLKTLTLVSFGLYVISGLLGFLMLNEEFLRETTVAQMEALGVAATEEMIEQGVQFGMVFGLGTVIATLVIGIILYPLVFLGLRNGKNWARILGTVLAVVGTAFTLFGLIEIGSTMAIAPVVGTLTLVLSILFVAVNVWWLITAYSKDVNAYLRARAGR